MSPLTGRRILLVEDEFVVGTMAQDMLSDLGATVLGPVATIAKGVALAESETLDAAVLDVNIRGQRVDPVAEVLRARSIPIVFATGYGQSAADRAREGLVIGKPYTQEKLVQALARVLGLPK